MCCWVANGPLLSLFAILVCGRGALATTASPPPIQTLAKCEATCDDISRDINKFMTCTRLNMSRTIQSYLCCRKKLKKGQKQSYHPKYYHSFVQKWCHWHDRHNEDLPEIPEDKELTLVDPCESAPCLFGGTCVRDGIIKYVCKCTTEEEIYPRVGGDCSEVDYTSSIGNCHNRYCEGGSKCTSVKKARRKIEERFRKTTKLGKFLDSEYNVTKSAESNQFKIFNKANIKQAMICMCSSGKKGPSCLTKCDTNHYGELCHIRCGPGCMSGKCTPETGACVCKDTHTGMYCETELPEFKCTDDNDCQAGGKCRDMGGYMVCDCPRGRKGEMCQYECANGEYGKNCRKRCGRCWQKVGDNHVCNKVSGKCEKVGGKPRCMPRFYGYKCIDRSKVRARLRGVFALLRRKKTSSHVNLEDGAEDIAIQLKSLAEGTARNMLTDNRPNLLNNMFIEESLEVTVTLTQRTNKKSAKKGRRLLQSEEFIQGDQAELQGVDAEFEMLLPAELAENSANLKQEMKQTIRRNVDELQSENLPGMELDKSSINIKEVALTDITEAETASRISNVTSFLIGVIVLVAVLIFASLGLMCRMKKINRRKERAALDRIVRIHYGQFRASQTTQILSYM